MKFFGRTYELKQLNLMHQTKSSFIGVIYGRRRVGKSRLLSEFIKEKSHLLFEGLENESTVNQISHFREQLAKQTGDLILLKMELPSWNRSFDVLTDFLTKKNKNKKTIIVFDEIQWMAVQRSHLISLIKYYWDNHWKNLNVDLILCGSVATFMVKKIIKSKSLYGRIDLEMRIMPMRPNEVGAFIQNRRSREEALMYQFIFGRIPKYFEHINPQKSFETNINQLCFQNNGVMVHEIEKIFYSQFKKSSLYIRIVNSLMTGPKTLLQISNYLKISSGGGLKEYLNNLELAQYIGSEASLDKKINSKYKRYFLTDEFLIFFKKYMEPNMNYIQKNTDRNLFSQIITPKWTPWLGFAFERFCLNNAEYLAHKMEFNNQLIGYGPYSQKAPGLQIDLLYNRSDKVIVICEMKYSKGLISRDIVQEVQSKIDRLHAFRGYSVEKALVTTYGAEKSLKK